MPAPHHHAPCKYFRRGHCKYGSACRYSHAPDDPAATTTSSSASDAGEDACKYYLRGFCRRGGSCRYRHPRNLLRPWAAPWGTEAQRAGAVVLCMADPSGSTGGPNVDCFLLAKCAVRGTWDIFAGKRAEYDPDPASSAHREALEESRGCVSLPCPGASPVVEEWVSYADETGHGAMYLQHHALAWGVGQMIQAVRLFRERRDGRDRHPDAAYKPDGMLRRSWNETSAMRWFCAPSLLRAIAERRNGDFHGYRMLHHWMMDSASRAGLPRLLQRQWTDLELARVELVRHGTAKDVLEWEQRVADTASGLLAAALALYPADHRCASCYVLA